MPLFVNVTPGTTINSNTTLDPATMNLLGTPTIDITGTIDGDSTLTVGAASITNSQLATMAAYTVKSNATSGSATPTDVTLASSLSLSTGSLAIATSGVTSTHLAASSVTNAAIDDGAISTGKLYTQKTQTILANGSSSGGASVPAEPVALGSGLTITGASELTVTAASRSSNVVTLTTSSAHGYSVGDYIDVTGLDDTTFNAYRVVTTTGTTGSTVKYANTGSNGSSGLTGTPRVRKILNSSGTPSSTLNVSSSGAGFAKLWVNFKGYTGGMTYTRTGATVTVTLASHGLETGMYAYLVFSTGTGGTATNGWYQITKDSSSQFHVTDAVTSPDITDGTGFINSSARSSYGLNNAVNKGIVRNDAGDYTIYFATAMADVNYCVMATTAVSDYSASTHNLKPDYTSSAYMTTTSCRIVNMSTANNNTFIDPTLACVTVFGN